MQQRSTLRIAAVSGVAALAVLAPAAGAFADGHAGAAPASHSIQAKKPAQLTVKGYVKYLKTQKTPAAKQTLAKFNKLNGKQKYTFVKLLQNRGVHLALKGSLEGRADKTFTKRVNSAVTVTRAADTQRNDKFGSRQVTYSVTESIYKIPVTTESVTVKYRLKGKKVIKPAATSAVTNTNAAVTVTPKKTTRLVVKGTNVRGEQTFTSTGNVKSFGKKVVKKGAVRAHGKSYTGILANR
ncbi:hypothetical protein ACIBKX_06470 [Streptomyces sp. NPDC050658]|uniref:hypothetical protein n=1 Tax=unclassified Streptomyces TaxID=2593676 RepID=UPI00342CF3B5